MDFLQLKYFSAIARNGSVSKAARELYITQPTLSRSIAHLEQEVGVPLFDRSKGTIRLNEYGRHFLASVHIVFDELEMSIQAVRRMYNTNQNIVSLACAIDDFLPDMLIKFSRVHPEIGIRQFNYPHQIMIEQLLDRSLDLVFSSRQIKHDNVVFEILTEAEYVILVHNEHPVANMDSISISELSHEHFICDSCRISREMLKEICEQSGFHPVISFEVESSELLYELIDKGAGVTLTPLPYYLNLKVKHENNNIACVHIQENIPKSIIGLAYHKGYEFSHAVRILITCIRKWLHEEDQLVKKDKLGKANSNSIK